MTKKKLKIIQGGRENLEASLAIAFFKHDIAEIDRISSQINTIQKNHPAKLALVKTPTHLKKSS